MEILGLDYEDILQMLHRDYQKREYHGRGLMKYLYSHGSLDQLEQSPCFIQNSSLAHSLQKQWAFSLPKIHSVKEQDKTSKYALELEDQWLIESVLIPMHRYYTLCISSQVGCARGCVFCRTAKMGYKRNLTVSEIVSQYMTAGFVLNKAPEHLVFMGMGEPLDNADNVLKAIDILSHPYGADILKRNISISTCGHVEGLQKLASLIQTKPRLDYHLITLSLSLNAARDSLRDQLMPVNKKWPLAELKDTLLTLPQAQKKDRLYIEYILIPGINDQPQDVDEVLQFMEGTSAKINLIPLNAPENSPYRSAQNEDMNRFHKMLIDGGAKCFSRRKKGEDILAACGQLATGSATAN